MDVGDVVQAKGAYRAAVPSSVRYGPHEVVEVVNGWCLLRNQKPSLGANYLLGPPGTPSVPEGPHFQDWFISVPCKYLEVMGEPLQELI